MNYNEYSKKAYENAVAHGFFDADHGDEHYLMLVVTEIAEAVEADRKNMRADKPRHLEDVKGRAYEAFYKDNLEDELADVAIRLFTLAGKHCIDFSKIAPCRYFRAYKAFGFAENAFALCKGLGKDKIALVKRIQFAIEYVFNWAKALNIDLEWYVKAKMQYNQSRPMLHGKKY